MAMAEFALLGVIVACFLCATNCELHRIVPSDVTAGEIPFVQSFHDPKYKIEFHPADAPFSATSDQEIIPMTDRDGQKYVCALPKPPAPQNAKRDEGQQNGSSIGLVTDARSSRKPPEELLDGLREKCFSRTEEWWMYELCYHGVFRQFHVDNINKQLQITQEFILGKFDKEATTEFHTSSPDVTLQKDPISQTAAQRYHSHIYTNGTLCDLTNDPRQTEVRFVCSKTGKIGIHSIKEAPSCKYTVIFYAPMLCKHPLFQEEQSPWIVIHCNEVVVPMATSDEEENEAPESSSNELLANQDDSETQEAVL